MAKESLEGNSGSGFREKEAILAKQPLEQSLAKLARYGGFDLLETTIDGVQNMNPEKKARKKIFITESSKKEERKNLKKRLEAWYNAVKESDSVASMIEQSQKKVETAQVLLKENLLKAVEEVRELETSYRSMSQFYKNAEQDKIKNISIMNAEMEQIQDLDNTVFIDAVDEELVANFDRLDLRDNYSMLVIPGYLGGSKVVDKWARIAHKNKVMMVTDFQHLDTPDDVMELFEDADLSGGDAYRANVIMTCNWLVGRGKYAELQEEDDLFIPPSTSLAGRIYSTLASQITAGKKHGSLYEVDGVKFPLKKSEISEMERRGLVPMVNEYGKVMAFSGKTLFNGDNIGLQTYSVVRVFDYVMKVLMDFLNRRAFENWDHNVRMDIQGQIVRFLDKVTGPGRLIEKFTIKKFERDPKQKDRIMLDIHMVPYFPAKTFLISLDGTKGDDPDNPEDRKWGSDYKQE